MSQLLSMPAAPVDPVNDPLFAAFDDDDKQWLKAMFVRLPEVGARFQEFLATPTALRLEKAECALEEIKRTGWVKRGVRNPETVGEHSKRFVRVMERVLVKVITDNGMSADAMQGNIRELVRMAQIHDMAEAIIGDIPPGTGIKPEEIKRLELLAATVIFDSDEYANDLRLIGEFIEQKTNASHIVRDFDLLDAVFMAALYEAQQPDKTGLFVEFHDYSEPRLKTNIGKQALASYLANKADILALDSTANSSKREI